MAFRKHQESKTHWEAVETIIILPKTTYDMGEQLSKAHKAEKENSWKMLHIILTSLRYLDLKSLAIGETQVMNWTRSNSFVYLLMTIQGFCNGYRNLQINTHHQIVQIKYLWLWLTMFFRRSYLPSMLHLFLLSWSMKLQTFQIRNTWPHHPMCSWWPHCLLRLLRSIPTHYTNSLQQTLRAL